MSRYTYAASCYDMLSAEPIYGVGRARAIPALHLREGSRVLDIGCGTGLNFPFLLVEADAEQLDHVTAGPDGSGATFDAVIFTYSLSLMPNWEAAWRRATSLVRPGGRAGIVDMGVPHGWAGLLAPAARLACRLGGADISARPWTLLEHTAQDVQSWSLRGGHIQVRVGTL